VKALGRLATQHKYQASPPSIVPSPFISSMMNYASGTTSPPQSAVETITVATAAGPSATAPPVRRPRPPIRPNTKLALGAENISQLATLTPVRSNSSKRAAVSVSSKIMGTDSRSVVLEPQTCLIVADNYCPQRKEQRKADRESKKDSSVAMLNTSSDLLGLIVTGSDIANT
jgi:hypothetical protein